MTSPLRSIAPDREIPERRGLLAVTERRERTAARVTRWRLQLLGYALANIAITQVLVLLFLPFGARLFSLTLLCVALVFAGAAPVIASLLQYVVIGFHTFKQRYRRLTPFYPRVAVIVPAWNEGAVIGTTIEHLIGMEYPSDRLRVYVVDDASTDETPAVVQEKAAEHFGRVFHLRRKRGGQGKAHTLNHGIAHVLGNDWAEAILIIDADVLFERDALRKMTRHLSDPDVGAVTAYIKEGTPKGNYLTRFIAYEYITAQAAARRAQNIYGALACLAGGAQLHSRESLVAIGGRIDTSSLAEDTVTTFKTQLSGKRVVFEGNAVVWAEEPQELVGLWKQRLRWARGNVQISLQFASLWSNLRGFGRIGHIPFKFTWFTILLMPVLMLGSAVGLIGLYFLNRTTAWQMFHVLWIWHIIAFFFQTLMSLAIDPQTARRSWRQALLFPGVISLAIMSYSIYPPFYDINLALWLKSHGLVLTPVFMSRLTLFVYAWCFLCIPCAFLGKVWADTPGYRWLARWMIYLGGYGPFLCAVTFASYLKEILNVTATWDKTIKTGRVSAPLRAR